MKEEHNRKLLNSFEAYLYEDFENYCQQHKINNNNKNFITYLIDKKLLPTTIIRRYTIMSEFKVQYPKHNYHKSRTVLTLASLFDLSSRHIWSLLKYDAKLNPKKNK